MRFKALLLTLFALGIAVAIAVAASPASAEKGKGKGDRDAAVAAATTGTTTGTTTSEAEHKGKGKHEESATCHSKRKLVLHGTFVSAGTGGFAMTVAKGNHGAKVLKGTQVTVTVDAKTQFHGAKKSLAEIVAGDRLVVQAYGCKSSETAAATLLARKVGVKGAKKDEDDDDDEGTTTSTTTGTTTGS